MSELKVIRNNTPAKAVINESRILKKPEPGEEKPKKVGRLMSIDAFRGFDMMWIMGLYGLVLGVVGLFGMNAENSPWIPAVFHHVPWNGFHFIDSVFPTFLFIAGLSFPFSLAKSREKGLSDASIWLKTLKRGIILVLLGVMYNGTLGQKFDAEFLNHFRFASVLQRIGIGWMLAGFIFLAIRSWKVRFVLFLGILFGWWALVQFVPAPGCPADVDWMMKPHSAFGLAKVPPVDKIAFYNLAVWVDHWLPGFLHTNWIVEPEGMLSHVGGVATAMIGMFAGEFVMKSRDAGADGVGQCVKMWLAAAVLLGIGWGMIFAGTPCIKAIWSSSFICCVGAYSLAMFSLFYFIIDVKGCTWWTTFFRVIGMNSITIYLGQAIFRTYDRVHGPVGYFIGHLGNAAAKPPVAATGLVGMFSPEWGALVDGLVYFFGLWAVLYFLYKKNVFLKI